MSEMGKSLSGKAVDFDPIKIFADHSLDKKPKIGTHTTVGIMKNGIYWGEECQGCQAAISGIFSGSRDWSTAERSAPVAIYSSLWKHPDQTYEEALAYWKFMMSKQWSPYRSILKDSEIIYHEDKPIAYCLRDMDHSPQVVANFAFAMRMPYAQDGYLRMFTALRAAGFTNAESSFVTANARLTPKGSIGFPYIGDYPFDTAWADMSWSAWKNGTPKATSKKISEGNGNYRPCNIIWSAGHQHAGCVYSSCGRRPTIVQKLLSGEFEYKGAFKKNFDSIKSTVPLGTVSFEKAVKILRDNKADWQVG